MRNEEDTDEVFGINTSFYDQASMLSAAGFTLEEMAIFFSQDLEEFCLEATDGKSELFLAIKTGKLKSNYLVMSKQQQMAENGNITAAQIYDKYQQRQHVEELKRRIFFG